MPAHRESRILPWTPEQLFDLVADVESYPKFLPWCLAARVRSRQGDELVADVVVGHRIWRETFTSLVHLERPARIQVRYGGGPLSHLHNAWSFEPAPTPEGAPGCRLGMALDIDMASPLLRRALGLVFEPALVRIIAAFEARAQRLYP